MITSALCPYCDHRTSVDMSVLGDHHVPGGPCDGSGRHIASLDSNGRAVLMANLDDFRVGDRVQALNTQTGREETARVVDISGQQLSVEFPDGHKETKHFTNVTK